MDREKHPCVLNKNVPNHKELDGPLLPVAGCYFFSVQISMHVNI